MLRRLSLFVTTSICSIAALLGQIDTDRVLKIGRNALYFDDYIVAIGYFNQVVSTRPWLADPYFYRSIAKLHLEDYIGAEADASEAIERNAFMPKAYLARGIARQNTQAWEGAEADYRKGLLLTPNDEGLGVNLAHLLVYRKQYAAADSAARRVLSFYPKSSTVRILLADALIGQKDTVAGLAQIDTLLRSDSTFAPAYARQAMIAYEKQDYKSGVQRLNKAIEADARDLSFYINRGMMRYQLNDLRGAMADYTHVIDAEPTNKVARFNRALLHAYVGNSNNAIKDLDIVIRQEPTNYHAVYNRALLYASTGRYASAVSDYDTVLKKYPRFVSGYWARSQAKRAMGHVKGADKDYWDAYDLDRALQKQGHRSSTKKQATPPQDTKAIDGEKETREDTDKNIEKYNLLVVAEPSKAPKAKYERQTRGRVQDRDVAIEPRKQYVLTYFAAIDQDLPQRVAYVAEVNAYNNRHLLPHRLLLSNREVALTAKQAESLEQDIAQAQEQIQTADGAAKADLALRLGIGRLLLLDLEGAHKEFGRAITEKPDFMLAYFLRSIATNKQMQANEAMEAPPPPTLSIANASSIAILSAHYKDALADLNKTIALAPSFAHAYYNRALLYTLAADLDLALADYDLAIEQDPLLAEAYYNRGIIHLSQGKARQGIADLSHAGEMGLYDAYNIIKQWRGMNQD